MTDIRDIFEGQRVLVTGGAGFIGSNVAARCLELGAQVTVYDNFAPSSGGNLENISHVRNSIELVIGDISSYDAVLPVVMDKNIVINCAASTSHPFSMREPWLNLDVNTRGVLNLLEAIRLLSKGAKLVHIGTSTQLGKLEYQPADELHPEFPVDMYSANKVVAEKYVLLYARTYGLHATVVRLSNVYGPRAAIHSPEFTFNNYFIGLALQDRDITVYQPGSQLRNVIYVDDAVEAILAAAASEKADAQTFFAVGAEHLSIAEIAEATATAVGGRVAYVDWPESRKGIEIGDAVISNQKMKDRLEWSPSVGLQEGLERTEAFFRSRMSAYLRK